MSYLSSPWSRKEFWEEKFAETDSPRWDLGQPSPTLQDIENRYHDRLKADLFVPGCGNGHDALFFAEKGYRVSAVDWAKQPLDHLRLMAKRKNVSIEILREDFWKIPEAWDHTFDVWVEHTFFCAIDPIDRPKYVAQVLRLLRPGGYFIGAMFINQDYDVPSIFPESEEPPFWASPTELKDLFERSFQFIELKPSAAAGHHFSADEFRSQAEWSVVLRRRSE